MVVCSKLVSETYNPPLAILRLDAIFRCSIQLCAMVANHSGPSDSLWVYKKIIEDKVGGMFFQIPPRL